MYHTVMVSGSVGSMYRLSETMRHKVGILYMIMLPGMIHSAEVSSIFRISSKHGQAHKTSR